MVLIGNGDRLVALIRLRTGEHLKHHDAERVNVTAKICLASADQFGAQIRNCPKEGLRCGGVVGRGSSEPEISNLDAAVIGQKDILGFEVAVDDARGVGCIQALEDGPNNVHCLSRSEGTEVLQQFSQRDPR